jgi:hypothetical protein
MIFYAGIAKKFRAEAFSTAKVVQNLSPPMKQCVTLLRIFWGKKPDLSQLKIFG